MVTCPEYLINIADKKIEIFKIENDINNASTTKEYINPNSIALCKIDMVKIEDILLPPRFYRSKEYISNLKALFKLFRCLCFFYFLTEIFERAVINANC